MDILRISIAEAANGFLVGELPSGEAEVRVTEFYDLKSSTSPVLTSNDCTEMGATGLYYWSFSNIDTAPTTDMIILWRMTATTSGRTTWGLVYIGGYPNVISGQTDKMNFAGDHITADVKALADSVITSAKIAASALDDKGNWNVGKTGYALTATTGLGNQTANITGNLSGSVGSVAPDGISASSIEDGAITGPKIAVSGVTQISDRMERVGGMLEAAKDAAVAAQTSGTEIDAKLEAGSMSPDPIRFAPTT